MNIHEYQAKELMAAHGVPVPRGELAATPAEAADAVRRLGAKAIVVKAQVHAGGRGQGGGVKVCQSPEEALAACREILGMTLVTRQTGPQGILVRKVYLEEGADIADELYLAVALDRGAERLSVMASPEGGMDIEEVAASTPEKIFTARVDPGSGFWDFQARQLFFNCGLEPKQVGQGVRLLRGLVKLAWEKEAALVEINPLALTGEGDLLALDAKINFDDSALKRHPEIAQLRDPEETDALERRAVRQGLNYIRLDGDVGVMVNGAGLAMATMDVIKMAGVRPANFLDVGGGANEDMIAKGFEVILSDPNVKAVLINIFGGILRCDVLAAGVVAAARKVDVRAPLVVRLEGANVEEGRRILGDSGLSFQTAAGMSEAASMIAQAAGGAA